MLKSKFVSNILQLLLDGDEQGLKGRTQIDFIEEADYEYTGNGVFIGFKHKNGIEKYRLTKDNVLLDGVEIKSPELEIGASCILFFSNGLIDYLEIWNYGGTYPNTELNEYILTQTWKESEKKVIKSE